MRVFPDRHVTKNNGFGFSNGCNRNANGVGYTYGSNGYSTGAGSGDGYGQYPIHLIQYW